MRLTPHPFSLRQLQYAVAVADTLSFRRAAELCGVSQPALSSQLAELEAALGVQLFERDRRRVLVTPAGKELIERARRILLETDDLVEAAKRLGDPLKGTLRIGVIPTIAPYLLPEIVPILRRRFPRLLVVWIEDKTAALLERMDEGTLDAAVLALEAELGVSLEQEVIGHDPFVVAMPKGHPLAQSDTPIALDDLHDSDVLLLDDGHCFREQALSLCSAAGLRELSFRATSLPTLAQMVAGGAGITLLPRLAVAAENRRGSLAIRRFAEPVPSRTLAVVWRKSSPLAPALREVAATLRGECERVEEQLPAAIAD